MCQSLFQELEILQGQKYKSLPSQHLHFYGSQIIHKCTTPSGDMYHGKEKSRVRKMESNGYRACGTALFSTVNKGLLDKRIHAQKSEEGEGGSRGCTPGRSEALRQEHALFQGGQHG